MDMADGVIPIMVGVILPTDGVIHITDMDHTGQDIIVDTGMGIMVAVDTIIPHRIIRILKEDEATDMDIVNPGPVLQPMVPGA